LLCGDAPACASSCRSLFESDLKLCDLTWCTSFDLFIFGRRLCSGRTLSLLCGDAPVCAPLCRF